MLSKLLSIIIISRNDDYMEDQLYRLNTVLCFLSENLSRLGFLERVEVILVDWGGESPLKEALSLSKNARKLTHFVTLSQTEVEEISPGTHFHSTLAVNVGLRRARGEFRMLTDSDCMMSIHSLKSLLDLLSGTTCTSIDVERSYLHIPRFQIPWELGKRRPSLSQWERYCRQLSGSLVPEGPSASSGCLGGYAACQLLHKDLWYDLNGYDESLRSIWGWCDNDLTLRLSQKYEIVNTSYFGIYSMHMEHLARKKPKRVGVDGRVANPMKISYTLAANDANWGLGDRSDIDLEQIVEEEVGCESPLGDGEFSSLSREYCMPERVKTFFDYTLVRDLSTVIGNPNINQKDFEGILILSGLSKGALPVSFAWFGALNLNLLSPFLAFSRGVESWFCNIWTEGVVEDNAPNNPGEMSGFLNQSSYKGNARVLLGNLRSSLETVKRSSLALGGLESVFVATQLGAEDFVSFLLDVFDSLAKGGCIVLEPRCEATETEALFSQWFSLCDGMGARPFSKADTFRAGAVCRFMEERPEASVFELGVTGYILIVSSLASS